MRRLDRLGNLLLQTGSINEHALADVLEEQRHTLPFGSLCYVLGHLDEEPLARMLSKQSGVPGVVLTQSVIDLELLADVPYELALTYNLLPIYEDQRRIFVAAEKPMIVAKLLRELQFVTTKTIVPHIALHIILKQTVRSCYRARERGERFFLGDQVNPSLAATEANMFVVRSVDRVSSELPVAQAHDVVKEDVTQEVVDFDELLSYEVTGEEFGIPSPRVEDSNRPGPTPSILDAALELIPHHNTANINLDDGASTVDNEGPSRVLLVDDDFATRHLLVKELQPLGYVTSTASTGGEAVRQIKANPPNLVVIDVMLPEVDGFQICTAIKQSRKYNHIPVVLMSAVIDSARVTDEVLRRYGADAYFEKPLDTESVCERITKLLQANGTHPVAHGDDGFELAMELYRTNRLDDAISCLRSGLEVDPLSAKHHFVLANLLQKKQQYYEAIDEYEATVDLQPDYFPALTRLAYLYFRQGFTARAVETWKRALLHCRDEHLRHNIEVFMGKLIADLPSDL